MKKNRILIASFLCLMMGMLPITQVTAAGVSVSPGDSYIWKIDRKLTDNEGTNENMTIYHLINITEVSQVVESTEIKYHDYVANSSSYEGKDLVDVNWNTTTTSGKLILNNSAPENSFGGFVNLDNADLTVLNNLTTEEQTEVIGNMLMVSSPEFFGFVFVMTLIAAFSIGGNVSDVNSTTLDTVKTDQITGSFMIGFNIFFDSDNTWHNMSTTAQYDLRYGKTNKILQEYSGTIRFNDKSYNETTDVYDTSFMQYETNAELVHPDDAIEGGGLLDDLISSIPGYPIAIIGIFTISSLALLTLKIKKIRK